MLSEKRREYHRLYSRRYRTSEKRKLWLQRNKEKLSEYNKKYCRKYYLDHKEKIDAQNKLNQKKNSGHHRISSRKWRLRNKEQCAEYSKKYRKENKDKILLKHHRRRLILDGLNDLTLEIIQKVYEENIKKFGTLTCIYCLQKIEFGKDTLEHKQPISRQGTNNFENLAISCCSCNCRKYNKTYEEYMGCLKNAKS